MTRSIFVCFILIFSQPSKASSLGTPMVELPPIVLTIGDSKTLSARPETPVQIQKKGILSLKDGSRQLRFIGAKIGETRVVVGQKSYQFIVMRKDVYKSWKSLTNWAEGKRGVIVEARPDEVILRGKLLTSVDFKELALVNDESSKFRVKTITNASTRNEINHYIQQLLEENNLPPADLSFSPSFQLKIGSEQSALKSQYQKTLNPFGIKIKEHKNSVSLRPVVKIKVMIAEVRKSFFRQFGIDYPDKVEANVVDTFKNLTWRGTFSADLMESQGFGKILASPSIVTQSNKKGKFHSGGEFPIKNSNMLGQSVQWKQYGIRIEALPKVDFKNRIRLDLKAEISAIDDSRVVDGIPALFRNGMQSTFNLERPRPIVISGLLKKEWGKSRDGLPWLSQIPVLNSLTSTQNLRNGTTELVFIVEPQIVAP